MINYLFVLWLAPRYISHWLFLHEVLNKFFCFEMQIQKVPLEYLSQVNVQVFFHALQDLNKSIDFQLLWRFCLSWLKLWENVLHVSGQTNWVTTNFCTECVIIIWYFLLKLWSSFVFSTWKSHFQLSMSLTNVEVQFLWRRSVESQ